MPRRPSRAFCALAPALLLAACKVGPDFHAPAPPPPSAGYGTDGGGRMLAGNGPAPGWWKSFGSPAIDLLVARALAANPGLEAADATLARARAHVAEVGGARLPQVDGSARIEHQEVNMKALGFDPKSFGLSGNPEFDLYSVGGGVRYSLDLFGREKRSFEGAQAMAEAERHRAEAAHLTLAGQVVIEALTIAAVRARIAAVDSLIKAGTENVSLTDARRRGGEGTMVEVLSAQSQLAEDKAMRPALDAELAAARARLAALVGVSPAELGPTDIDLAGLTLPAQVPVAVPSALVRQRPDILVAEADIHAATAAVGVATAALYPDLSLGATFTEADTRLGDFFSPTSRGYDIFAGISAPIFHGGTLKARKRGAEAEARAAAARYRQTVLDAFAQVATLVAALDSDARALAAAREANALAERSLVLSRKSYRIGNSGVLQVIEAGHAQERSAITLADALGKQALDIARLQVATAGGWTGETPP